MFKAFTQPVRQIVNYKTGEIINTHEVMTQLKDDVTLISELTEWSLNNDKTLLNDLEILLKDEHDELGAKRNHNAKLAQELNIRLPEWVKTGRKSGNSRLEHIYQHKVMSEAKSWLERRKTVLGKNDKWISKGWKRTADVTAPVDLIPKISLSAGAVQYAQITNNPFNDNEIHLKLVINGIWYVLIFNMPQRFRKAKKITLPDVSIDKNGDIKFNFTAEMQELPLDYSSQYVIGVDVGITEYVTISVIDTQTRESVYSCGVSRSAQSLINSIEATKKQVKYLRVKNTINSEYELVEQRLALTRKRRELSIQVAQEIVELSRVFDNALVIFEDLSHIKNTMKHGRWNRGELVKWVNTFLEASGSKSYSVNAAYTSQDCYCCGNRGYFRDYSIFVCKSCGNTMNRDVNASINIGLRFLDKLNKEKESTYKKVLSYQSDKQKKKNSQRVKPLIRGGARNVNHNSVSKNKPTPKQVKSYYSKVVKTSSCTVMNNMIHTVITDEAHSSAQDSQKATIIINDKKYHKHTKNQQ